jgi:hypothetical protein
MFASETGLSHYALSVYQRIKEKDYSKWRRSLTLSCKM